MIIGLCGPSGSGKSTLAKKLANNKSFYPLAFADPIKLMQCELLRIQGIAVDEIIRLVYIDKKEETEYLNGRSSRHCQQTLGTEWGRDLIDDLLWIGVWERRLYNLRKNGSYNNIVVEDVRFLNEAEVIRHYKGKIIRVDRDGHKPSAHISEREYLLIQPDFTIYNDAEPSSMIRQLDKYLSDNDCD